MDQGRRIRSGFGAVLSEEDWGRLVQDGRPRRYRPGDVLMRQGDAAEHVTVLMTGQVKITRLEPDGEEVLLAVRGAGEVLGEISVFDGRPRSATVEALRPCTTRILPAPAFRRFIEERGLYRRLIAHVVARLREGEDRFAELAVLSAAERLVGMLLKLAELMPAGEAPSFGLTQQDLARAIGVSRSAVAYELSRLRSLGVVRTARRQIVVQDLDRLRALASGDAHR